MWRIKTMNKISPKGLAEFPKDKYEIGDDVENPHAILLRSASLHEVRLPKSVLAVARAGAGVNNIPVQSYTEAGIAVFNTPGSNANAVTELTLMSLIMTSRKILDAIAWSKGLSSFQGDDEKLAALVEEQKSLYSGPEIRGKTLGVIGLGSVGNNVANSALTLGMNVAGYDPSISVDKALTLSSDVRITDDIYELLSISDYITLHLPVTEKTQHILNAKTFKRIKKGARLLNMARGDLVDEEALLDALDKGIIEVYVTDFITRAIAAHPKTICFPHLGASTPEAEDKSAVMAARELRSFLEYGDVENSVNLHKSRLSHSTGHRVIIINKNIPNMLSQFGTMLAASDINIESLVNQAFGDFAFNIIETGQEVTEVIAARINGINGVVKVRSIEYKV
jgi:D-3-phosphoglycerate dehydrogenase